MSADKKYLERLSDYPVIPETNYLIEPHVPLGPLIFVAGLPKTFKIFLGGICRRLHPAVIDVEHDPQGAADQNEEHDGSEAQRDQFVLRRWFQVEVQKIPQVDHDLRDRRNADGNKDLYRPQRASGDEAEWNRGQHQR
jgi:hypothetical protein